ncbi:hypothetical protein R80B4_03151 [Fibrobacteres bacterium R8-0-B4]
MTAYTKRFTGRAAAFAFAALAAVCAASAADHGSVTPHNAGETLSRNAGGLSLDFDGAMGNPALMGLDMSQLSRLYILPFSAALWSGKPLPSIDWDNGFTGDYFKRLTLQSLDYYSDYAGEQVWENMNELINGLRGGVGVYAGAKVTPAAYATQGLGVSVSTFSEAGGTIPGGLLLPILSDRTASFAEDELNLSELRLKAMWASEIAVKLGRPADVPFIRNLLGLDIGAAGIGVKLLLGHAYLDAEMEEGGVLRYDTESDKYTGAGRLKVMSTGTGLSGAFKYNGLGFQVNGVGAGFDVGAVFQDKNQSLSFDIRDIGLIFWSGKEMRTGSISFGPELMNGLTHNDLPSKMKYLFDFVSDTLTPDAGSYVYPVWLPASVNIGYTNTVRFDNMTVRRVIRYVTAGMVCKQPLLLDIGQNTYLPSLAPGMTLGFFSGYLPLRYGMIFGGPERMVSVVGAGFDVKRFSLDAFYKAVGTPWLRSKQGVEAGGGLTVRWGFPPDTAVKVNPPPKPVPPETKTVEIAKIQPPPPQPQPVQPPPPPPPPQPVLPPPPPPPPQITVEETQTLLVSQRAINFLTGSAKLAESSYAPLRAIADLLARYPGIRYEVQGHTDSQGADTYNLLLSAERAAAVKSCLVSMGAPEPSLVAVGYGKTQPIADNNTVVGRARNRRVDFVQILSQDHYDWAKQYEAGMSPWINK